MFLARTVAVRQRRLPHWTTSEGTYFVTFRLIDAMSAELARRIASRRKPHRLADRFLDRGTGRCWLRDPRIAMLVDQALRFYESKLYLLHAWTIMPNHVHVALRLLGNFDLGRSLGRVKGYSGHEANKVLGLQGLFWQEESYDSLIHDQHQLSRAIRYVAMNPVNAGLTRRLEDWPWTRVLRTEFSLGERHEL